MECFNTKRRRKKERDQKKFHQLTPHASPTHSQPSTLGHGQIHDPRLPKVGSNGLWMGTPGIYAATPSPAYYYGRPGLKAYPVMQPAVMQRASSETRLPQRDRHVPSSHAGHAVYASAASQPRIYHSQQLASLTPLYEVMDPRDGSIYDVYQIGGSKTRLLQEHGKSSDRQSKGGKRAERSHSELVTDPVRRPQRPKSSHESHRSSKTASVTKETVQVHEARPKPSGDKLNGVENPAFSEPTEKTVQEHKTEVVASATDSMKLLAKNKTDDQKTVVPPETSETENKQITPPPSPTPVPALDPSLHYTYGGDIYAVPDKEEGRRRSRSENPILARMQDMVLERSESLGPTVTTHPVIDPTGTPEPLLATSDESSLVGGTPLIQNPIYQDVEEIPRANDTVRSAADETDGAVNSVSDSAAASHDLHVNDVAGASDVHGDQLRATKETLDTRWSTDTDAATDELSRAGKHISVTAEAFGFLDTYLSDDEGGDSHSPPKSPVLSDREEMLY